MPCIHGLDETNCPMCRITQASLPKTALKNLSAKNNPLKPEHPLFKGKSATSDDFIENLSLKRSPSMPEIISKPMMVTDLPNFENKMFLDRLDQINLSKSDKFGISKKTPVGSPELRLNKEQE